MIFRSLLLGLLWLASPVHAGLVAHWSMNQAASPSVDRVNATSAVWGAGVSSATTPCRLAPCLAFNDTSTAVMTVTTPAVLNLTTAFSVAVWVSPSATAGDGVVEKTVGGAINTAYSLFFEGGPLKFRVKKGSLTTIEANAGGAIGVMEHYVATYDGATMRLYRNTVLQTQTASVATPIDGGSGNFLLGTLAGSVYPLSGHLDEVRVYDHALSLAELTRLYVRARPR